MTRALPRDHDMKPAGRREAISAIDFLRRHDSAAAMLPAAERLVNLRQDLLALMPATLRQTCDVSGFDDETVVLRVSSASAAAKIRQTLPRLRDGLLERGWKVNAIRMRVQPRISSVESTGWKSGRAPDMGAAGIAAFAVLDSGLEDSPLKTAVARLLGRRGAAAVKRGTTR